MDPLQKEGVDEGKARSLSIGLKIEKGPLGVGEGPEGKDRQEEEVEKVEDLVVRLPHDPRDLLRGEGKGDVKEDAVIRQKNPAKEFRKAL